MGKATYLATTGISEIWDFNNKLLLLGPWCLTSKKNKTLLEDKDYSLISSPWSSTYKIKEAADYCYKVYQELLPKLSDNFNSIHNVSYPQDFWRVLLGYWLLTFIGVFYDRYVRIKSTYEIFPNIFTYVLPFGQCHLASRDTYDFTKKLNEDDFNLKLFSSILHKLYPENIIEKEFKLESRVFTFTYSRKRQLFYRLISSFDNFLKCPVVLSEMYQLSHWNIILYKIKSGFKALSFMDFSPFSNKISLENNYSIKTREKLKLPNSTDEFKDLLYKIITKAIPLCYIENFRFYKDSVGKTAPKKIVGSAIGWYENERFKFFAAKAITDGAKLINFQYGGGFGFSLSLPHEILSLENDIFYTWGWLSLKKNKTKPLPSPYFSKLSNSYSHRINKILFVSTAAMRYQHALVNILTPNDMQKYYNDKSIFFQRLSKEARGNLLYRSYPHEFGWNESEFIRNLYPGISFVNFNNNKITKLMQKVNIVVIDHPHTSFLEALTINVPCVFYWDHEVYLMRPEAEEYFELLRQAGILYKEPQNAAKKVNEIFLNPSDWWLSKEVQDARLKFCEHFAYSRADWMKIWIEEFKKAIG